MVTGEDNVVQHYAVQALDNLATQLKGDHSGAAARLASLRTFEVLSSLYNLMQDSKIEPLRATASSALSRICLLYTSPSPRDVEESRMPSSA